MIFRLNILVFLLLLFSVSCTCGGGNDSGDDAADDDDSTADDSADDSQSDDSGADDSGEDDSGNDSADDSGDDTGTGAFDEDLARGCVELPPDVVDLGFDELAPWRPGCGVGSFHTPDGVEICVVKGGMTDQQGQDIAIDSEGNTYVAATLGRDLRLFSLSAEKIAAGGVRPSDWNFEIVDFMAVAPRFAIDADDTFHLIYTDLWNKAVKYARGKPGEPWTIETVETMSDIGMVDTTDDYDTQNALALGPEGTPHAVWHNWDDRGLHYGHRAGGVWETRVILSRAEAGDEAGFQNAIDAAADGSVHVATLVGDGGLSFGALYYGTDASGDFAFEPLDYIAPWHPDVRATESGETFVSYWAIDETLVMGWTKAAHHKPGENWTIDKISLVLNPLGMTSLYQGANGAVAMFSDPLGIVKNLRRSRWNGSVWNSEILYTFDQDDGRDPTVQACANDGFSLAFIGNDYSSLNWLQKQGSALVSSRISSGIVAGAGMTVSLDGSFHGVFQETVTDRQERLNYVTNAGGVWSNEVIDEGDGIGGDPSVAVDSQGRVHVSYRENTPSGNLKYALKENGTWSIEVVDSHTGLWPRIRALSLDAPVIYYRSTDAMTIAVKIDSSWTFEVINTEGSPGCDLAIDANDGLHTSYRIDDELYYAKKNGNSWEYELVATFPDPLIRTSMDIDHEGKAHMAIFLENDYDLFYATNASGSWTVEVITNFTLDKGFVRIDESGNLHLAYSESGCVTEAQKIGAVWQKHLIDCVIGYGGLIGFEIDGDGVKHIATDFIYYRK